MSDHVSHNHHAAADDRTLFGFWVYLMTDLLMFAALFATYAVLRGNTFGGPSGKELFNMPFVLTETFILLTSSFTCGVGLYFAKQYNKTQVFLWFGITLLLGLSFLGMELNEFSKLISEGNSFQRSAFLSAFFTLVGTHGLHIMSGIFWLLVLLIKLISQKLTNSLIRKFTLFSLFWHFLDIVWIFIYTVVYLTGKI